MIRSLPQLVIKMSNVWLFYFLLKNSQKLEKKKKRRKELKREVLRLSFQSIYFNFQNEVAFSRIVIVNRQQ